MKGSAYHGWKCHLPDKFWPVTLDNFFDNPDEIRELGLRMLESDKVVKSIDEGGKWPGYRSEQLWEIDEELTHRITEKILSCYFNLTYELILWERIEIKFNLIPSLDKDKNSIKNKGWIHRDGPDPRYAHTVDIQAIELRTEVINEELAGLIYLTPDIERDTGTSLFDMKKDQTLDDYDKAGDARMPLFKGERVNDEEIKEKWERSRSCFIEKVRFENVYNRLIMYDVKEFHAANSYYTSKDNRLTLGFFIGGIRADKWPLERLRQIKC